MNFYILKTMGGERFEITPQEFSQIGNAKGAVYIKSCDSWINMSSVSAIYPKSNADKIEDKKSLTEGYLHDGTMVKKHFGEWIMAGVGEIVKIDPQYYPEVATDQVFSQKEWNEVKKLNLTERLMLIDNNVRKSNPEPINKLLNEKICGPSKKSEKK